MTHQNLRLGKCWKLFWATLSSAVFKICDQRSVNVSSNAVCKCQIPHKYGHGEMRNKKLTNRRNDITQGWQFCSPPWKRKGKKRKKNVITRRGIRIRSPIQVRTATNFVERTKHITVLVV